MHQHQYHHSKFGEHVIAISIKFWNSFNNCILHAVHLVERVTEFSGQNINFAMNLQRAMHECTCIQMCMLCGCGLACVKSICNSLFSCHKVCHVQTDTK